MSHVTIDVDALSDEEFAALIEGVYADAGQMLDEADEALAHARAYADMVFDRARCDLARIYGQRPGGSPAGSERRTAA